ncbi:MAG: beta strand repeat-containing protein [Patescibacteria group bacterium]
MRPLSYKTAFKTITFLFCAGFLLFGLAEKASAATYYVRADGLVTAGNKANATSPNASTTSLSMAQVNLASFLAGDHVLFSSQGGNYTATLVLPSGGSGLGSEVTYANVPSETPVIAITSGYLIDTNAKSNIIIQGITANYVGLAASTNIGIIIGAGSNIQFNNVTSSMGGFGYNFWSNSNLSNLVFNSVTLTNCRAGTLLCISLQGASNSDVTIRNSVATNLDLQNITTGTMTNSTLTGSVTVTTGSDILMTNSHVGGVIFSTVASGTVSNITGSSGLGFIFTNSSDIIVNDSSMIGGTSYGGFQVDGTSHDITYNRDIANSNGTHGFVAKGTSNNITYNNCTADNNGNIGFLASISATNVTYWRSEASYNGTVDVVTDGGGFLPHDLVSNVKCYYCIAHHNYNEGIGDVSDGANNAYYNSTNWDNGYAIGETFKGSTVTNPSARSNIYYRKAGGSFVVNDGIFGGGKPREILNTGPSYTTLDYNLYKPVNDNEFYSTSEAIPNISWTAYHPTEPNSINSDPLFTNGTGSYSTSTDYQLTYLSPAIDSGTTVAGVTTDFAGNPIYGVPDMGAYEYQPPHDLTLGTPDTIDRGAGARIYGDGKFRDLGTTNSNAARLKITPSGGSFDAFGSTMKRPAWLDVTNITNWINTHKTWTESNASSSSMVTDHTIGDLNANKYYTITITGATASDITGINGTTCNNGVCQSNGSGTLSFRYSGGYSNHTFDVFENPPAPTLGTATTSTIPLIINTNGNPGSVTYAVYDQINSRYFTSSGAITATPTFFASSSWSGLARGLSASSYYTFQVIARSGDGLSSATSSGATAVTASAAVNLSKTIVYTNEGIATDTYTIVLNSQPTSTVQILISPDSSSLVSPSTINFTPANWSTPVTVTVTAVVRNQGGHLSTITHTASSIAAGFRNVTIASVTNSITAITVGPGGGGGSPSSGQLLPSPSQTGGNVTVPSTPPEVTQPTQSPSQIPDPSNLQSLLDNLSLPRNIEMEDLVLKQVRADAKEFKLVLNAGQEMAIRNFIVYGISPATIKLGQGERRAVVRDYMETVHRADFVWSDIERLTTGLIPLVRNLALERQNVSRALPVFLDIFGHVPNFKLTKENLAWNTLMYRIRFPRDMVKELAGLKVYFGIYKHYPTTPFGWSVVRVLGYVK